MYTGLIDGKWVTGLGTLLRFAQATTGIAIKPSYPAVAERDDDDVCAADPAFDAFRDLASAGCASAR